MPKLDWRGVLGHAWGHTKESWRVALAGAVVTAVLPVLIQWGDSYNFSESGWDKVTAGGWIWSIVGVGAWLVLVALWHCARAPIEHGREVLAARDKHHAAEIERAREEAKAEAAKPSIGQYVHQQIVVTTPEQAAELVQRVPGVEARPLDVRPEPQQQLQAAADADDDQAGDTGQREPST